MRVLRGWPYIYNILKEYFANVTKINFLYLEHAILLLGLIPSAPLSLTLTKHSLPSNDQLGLCLGPSSAILEAWTYAILVSYNFFSNSSLKKFIMLLSNVYIQLKFNVLCSKHPYFVPGLLPVTFC